MSNLLLLITVALYTYQVMKLRKEVQELKDDIKCIDISFWDDEECDGKI